MSTKADADPFLAVVQAIAAIDAEQVNPGDSRPGRPSVDQSEALPPSDGGLDLRRFDTRVADTCLHSRQRTR